MAAARENIEIAALRIPTDARLNGLDRLGIRSRLVLLTGNTNKLSIALALMRVVSPIVPNARLLVDSWFMRRWLVLPLLSRGICVSSLYTMPWSIPQERHSFKFQ